MNRGGGVGIIGVIVIVLVILFLVGVDPAVMRAPSDCGSGRRAEGVPTRRERAPAGGS